MRIISKIVFRINILIRKYSHWYNDIIFQDCKKFWQHTEFDLEIVNLGSSSAKSCFNYDGLGVKAANWALAPQSFVGDYAILSNYCSYLKKGATVLIPLCPFSSLGGGNDDLADKYYSLIRPISIPNASLRRRNNVQDIQREPLKYYPVCAIIQDIKALLFKKKENTCRDIEEDAKRWIESWKKEFSIYSFDNPLSLINQDRYNDSVKALQHLLEFCLSHGFKPVIVVPPMTLNLYTKFNKSSWDSLVNNFIEKCRIDGVKVLDYTNQPELVQEKYYQNAFVMNSRGASAFTKNVLIDIDIDNISSE